MVWASISKQFCIVLALSSIRFISVPMCTANKTVVSVEFQSRPNRFPTLRFSTLLRILYRKLTHPVFAYLVKLEYNCERLPPFPILHNALQWIRAFDRHQCAGWHYHKKRNSETTVCRYTIWQIVHTTEKPPNCSRTDGGIPVLTLKVRDNNFTPLLEISHLFAQNIWLDSITRTKH